MRSDLVFEAICRVPNRYRLCSVASMATRKMHKPNTRVSDTTNYVLRNLPAFNERSGCGLQARKAGLMNDASSPSTILPTVMDSSGAILGREG
jgi:hypothetical protein